MVASNTSKQPRQKQSSVPLKAEAEGQEKAHPIQTLLNLSGEGGGYEIEGRNLGNAWQFRVQSSSIFDDDEDDDEGGVETSRSEPRWLPSLESALAQINHGWPHLYPSKVHQSFAEAIWQQVDKHHRDSPLPDRVLKRWIEAIPRD